MLFRPEAFGKQVPVDAYLDKWQSPSGSMSRHYSHVSVQRPSRFQTTRLKIKYSSSYSCSSPQNPGLQLKRKAREDIRHSDILPGFFPAVYTFRAFSLGPDQHLLRNPRKPFIR